MESLLGQMATLAVARIDASGAWLTATGGPPGPNLRLPPSELPPGSKVGDPVRVFVHLDSDDRPVATTRTPRLLLGEVEFLEVTDLAPFGAFVSWGLTKDLLVPLREQTRPLRLGDWCLVGLYLDDTNRLAGTMRVAEMLRPPRVFAHDEWVDGVAWRYEEGLGLFVILERKALALLPATEPHTLAPGDAARFRVAHVFPDRKVEVSLRGLKHDEIDGDAERLLSLLASPAPPRLGDSSSPDQIRAVLGISKKAFKRAAGRLLKTGRVEFDDAGFLRVRSSR